MNSKLKTQNALRNKQRGDYKFIGIFIGMMQPKKR